MKAPMTVNELVVRADAWRRDVIRHLQAKVVAQADGGDPDFTPEILDLRMLAPSRSSLGFSASDIRFYRTRVAAWLEEDQYQLGFICDRIKKCANGVGVSKVDTQARANLNRNIAISKRLLSWYDVMIELKSIHLPVKAVLESEPVATKTAVVA